MTVTIINSLKSSSFKLCSYSDHHDVDNGNDNDDHDYLHIYWFIHHDFQSYFCPGPLLGALAIENLLQAWWWWWWWWWWWIVFVVWLTDKRRLALSPAGTIVRDPHHLESPTRREQDLNPRRNLSSGFVEWSCAAVLITTLRRHGHHVLTTTPRCLDNC